MSHHDDAHNARARALIECAQLMAEPLAEERLQGYLRLLADVPPAALAQALDRHMNDPTRGRFFPRPADVRAQLPTRNARPGADAAWALALQSFDEGASVVWTPEVEAARNLARGVWAQGDQIGARMAFRSAYDELVGRAEGPPQWRLSVGVDGARREEAVREAQALGLIGEEQARQLLPAPPAEPEVAALAGRIAGKGSVVPFPEPVGAAARFAQAVRAGLAQAERTAGQRRQERAAEQDAAHERQAEERRRVHALLEGAERSESA